MPLSFSGRLVALVGIFAFLLLGLWGVHHMGAKAEEQRQVLARTQAELRTTKASLDDYQRRVLEAQALAEKRAQSAERIRTITKETVREVPVRISPDACPLPGGWRVLHDAAAEGTDPAPAGGLDAAPVAPQDAAGTVIENYGQYHDLADRLTKLQQYVRGQLK